MALQHTSLSEHCIDWTQDNNWENDIFDLKACYEVLSFIWF